MTKGIRLKFFCKVMIFICSLLVSSCIVVYSDENYSKRKEGKIESKTKLLKGQYKDYNLIMISLGNVGVEHMSLYGYKRKTTPFLDKWSKDSVIFENVFSPASWTLPVATSLFTSLQPYSHKVLHRNWNNILDPRIKTFPEILKEEGYETASFTGGLDYANSFGHMRGFVDYKDNPPFTSFVVSLEQAKEWLQKKDNHKFFLFIHGYDAHSPFDPPRSFKGIFSTTKGKNITVDYTRAIRGYENAGGKDYTGYYYREHDKNKINKITLTKDDIEYLEELYDEEVLYEDYLVGEFLKRLDKEMLSKTIIIILGDHGEMFAKHGRFGRAGGTRGTLYDDVVRVPLIMKFPDKLSKRIKGLVQTVDVMPTVLNFLGVESPQYIQGKNLDSLMMEGNSINQYVFAGSEYGPGFHYHHRTFNEFIRNKEWKLIHEKDRRLPYSFRGSYYKGVLPFKEKFELYHLKDDPDELVNVIDKYPEVFNKLSKELQKWADETKSYDVKNLTRKQFSPELLEKIKEGGYW